MNRSRSEWQKRIGLLVGSCAVIVVILMIGEAACRLFTSINFLDNSRGMFQANRFGNSYGNTPNFEGISFGERFRTDENGFRTPLHYDKPSPTNSSALLILGDSVGFGPAVSDDRTVAGLLRAKMSEMRIYNASVIGYDTFDYKNAGSAIASKKPEISSAIILLCLNDVNDASTQLIRSQTANSGEPAAIEVGGPLRSVNNFLRSRSKLYLWLKNIFRDTQMEYFRADLASYQKSEANVEAALRPLVELKTELDVKGISMTIFILPNEAQLRPNVPEDFFLPQNMLTGAFAKNGIDFLDLTRTFSESRLRSSELFLYGDPMHLSEAGMKIAADKICTQIAGCGK